MVEHSRLFIYTVPTERDMCKLCNLRAIPPPGLPFVDDHGLNYSTRGVFLGFFFAAVRCEKCQCQDSMHALGALASSKQLPQMVCSLCHPLFPTPLARGAIKQQRRHRRARFTSNRKIKEADWATGSFITQAPLYLTFLLTLKARHLKVTQSCRNFPRCSGFLTSDLPNESLSDCLNWHLFFTFKYNMPRFYYLREYRFVYTWHLSIRPGLYKPDTR